MYYNKQLTTDYYEQKFLSPSKTLNKLSAYFENVILFVFIVLLRFNKKFQNHSVTRF